MGASAHIVNLPNYAKAPFFPFRNWHIPRHIGASGTATQTRAGKQSVTEAGSPSGRRALRLMTNDK